jgi:hypothetical protein
MRLKIADTNINLNGDINQFFIDRVADYIITSDNINSENNNQIEINFAICDYIEIPKGNIIATKDDRTWLYDENGDYCYFDYNSYFKKCVFVTTISKNEELKANIKFYNYNTKEELEFLNNALRESKKNEPNPKNRIHEDIKELDYPLLNSLDQCMRYIFLYNNSLVIHSSAISYNGDGIIFSAPSGTGKTTHTNLWKNIYPNVDIINDDSPIISIKKDEILLYGSPWAGASGINKNSKVPLKAIVFLEQAPIDSIQKLSSMVALSKLLNEIAKPMDKALMDKTFDLINILLTKVPCYLLKCTPTDKAVDVIWSELYDKNE